jgi:hypothetical protein
VRFGFFTGQQVVLKTVFKIKVIPNKDYRKGLKKGKYDWGYGLKNRIIAFYISFLNKY